MSKRLTALLSEISEAEFQIAKLTKEVILQAEKDIKGAVRFESRQEYDDNNYYTHVSLSYIDDIYFDEFDVMDLDEDEITELFSKLTADPKTKVKELLHLDDEDNSLQAKVISYWLKKKITPEVFFSTFSILTEIKHLKLPEDKIEYT